MLNKAILVGRLTKDPEMRSTAAGISVCSFTVAIPRKYAKQGEQRQSDFINSVAFNKTADFISRYFTKGNMISIDGSIQTRTWDDSDGKRHWVTEVVILHWRADLKLLCLSVWLHRLLHITSLKRMGISNERNFQTSP